MIEKAYKVQFTVLMLVLTFICSNLYATDLVGWWKLDGDPNDSSLIDNAGQVNGAGATFFNDSQRGKVFKVDGTSYMAIPHNQAYEFDDQVSVSCWFKGAPDTMAWAGIVDKWEFRLIRAADLDAVGFSCQGASNNWIWTLGRSDFDNNWHHVAGVYDGANISYYVDGVLASSLESTGAKVIRPDLPILIGLDANFANYFKGCVSDVRLYHGALTAQQVVKVMDGAILWAADLVSPLNGDVDIAVDSSLSWTSGPDAPAGIDSFVLYISEDSDAVKTATPDSTDVTVVNLAALDNSYSLSGVVQSDKTYYWRVDEVLTDGQVAPSAVYSFSTVQSLPVFVQQPTNQVAKLGETVTLETEVANATSYRWYNANNEPVYDSENISGSNTPVIVFNSIQEADYGSYKCFAYKEGVGGTSSVYVTISRAELVNYWSFDEGDGNASADAINSADAVLINAGWGAGISGNSAVLDGYDGCISASDVSVSDMPFTVSMWFSPARDVYADSARMDLLYWKQNGRPYISLNKYKAGKVGLYAKADDYIDLLSKTNGWAKDQWYNLIASFDGKTYKVYVDGQLEASVDSENANEAASSLMIGSNDGNNVFAGSIDEVKIFNYALAPAEIAAIYTQFAGGQVCVEKPEYDFNGDCKVSLEDYAVFAEHWQEDLVVTQ